MTLMADNAITDIKLNGVSTGLSLPEPAAGQPQTFTLGGGKTLTLSSGFSEGMNVLEFVVFNAGTTPNPGAFRVDLGGTANPVPEPGALTLCSLAVVSVLVARRRRRGANERCTAR
jgi:hypothetical protein